MSEHSTIETEMTETSNPIKGQISWIFIFRSQCHEIIKTKMSKCNDKRIDVIVHLSADGRKCQINTFKIGTILSRVSGPKYGLTLSRSDFSVCRTESCWDELQVWQDDADTSVFSIRHHRSEIHSHREERKHQRCWRLTYRKSRRTGRGIERVFLTKDLELDIGTWIAHRKWLFREKSIWRIFEQNCTRTSCLRESNWKSRCTFCNSRTMDKTCFPVLSGLKIKLHDWHYLSN